MRGSPAKLLAKLNSKPAQFDRAPSGTDGLTSLDVAHALGLNRNAVQTLLVRVKWANDSAAIAPLVDALTAKIEAKARRQKWRLHKRGTIRRMVVLALREREAIRPRRVLTTVDSPYEAGAEKCRGCRGVGRRYSTRQGKDITCDRCGGSGDRRWSDAERAGHCGLHRSTWPDLWERRFLDVVEMLKSIEGRALNLVRAYTAETAEEMARILDGTE